GLLEILWLHYRPAQWCVANADVRPSGGPSPASVIATIRCGEPASAKQKVYIGRPTGPAVTRLPQDALDDACPARLNILVCSRPKVSRAVQFGQSSCRLHNHVHSPL